MKMIINKNIWALVLSVAVFFSCSEEEGPASVIQSLEPINLSASSFSAITVAEDGATHTINIPMDDTQLVDVSIEIANGEQSTASEGSDFSFSTDHVDLLAFSGGGTFDITVNLDLAAEGEETIYLALEGDHPLGGPAPIEFLAITIRDSIYTTPAMTLDWSGEILPSFGGFFWQDQGLDVDLLVLDQVSGADVSGYSGASAGIPEEITADEMANGTYDLVANLWSNPLAGCCGPVNDIIPLNFTLALGGVGTASFNANDIGLTPVWTLNTPSDQAGVNNILLGTVTVNGNELSVTDGNGTFVGTFGTP